MSEKFRELTQSELLDVEGGIAPLIILAIIGIVASGGTFFGIGVYNGYKGNSWVFLTSGKNDKWKFVFKSTNHSYIDFNVSYYLLQDRKCSWKSY